MNTFTHAMTRFAQEEEGAQVVEYALIIAVVSIGLVAALGGSTSSIRSGFTTFVERVTTCLTTANSCV